MSTRILRTWYPVIGVAAILFVLLAGCTGTNYGPAPVTTQATPATTSPPATPAATTVVTTTTIAQTTTATTAPATTATVAPTIQSPPPAVAVTIQNFAFSPPSVTVPIGTTVTWTNQDSAPHHVVSDATPTFSLGAIFMSTSLEQGQKFSFTFNNAGTYAYHCGIHPFMTGTITVT